MSERWFSTETGRARVVENMRAYMGQRGITTVLMDLDDTSVDTSGVFGLAFYEASENLLKS